MSYIKQNWLDRVVENPLRYSVENHEDGSITLTPLPGAIYEVGTPVNAEHMNHIEEGIGSIDEQIEYIKKNYLPSTHPSSSFGYNGSTGRITHNGNDVKVLNSANADNSTKWGGMNVRGGNYTSGASGFITFGTV